MTTTRREQDPMSPWRGLADILCTSGMCFGRIQDETIEEEFHHEPTISQPLSYVVDSDDDASSCSSYGQGESAWDSPSRVPSVIRMEIPTPVIRPSTPSRDSVVSVEHHGNRPPLLKPLLPKERRQLRRGEKSGKLLSKNDDDDTVSTQSSYSSSSSRTNDKAAWSSSSRSLLFKHTGAPVWNDAVIENTTDGIKISAPPELMTTTSSLATRPSHTTRKFKLSWKRKKRATSTTTTSDIQLPHLS